MVGAASERRVLICGAGIAGLTLAILLKERGWHPVVVERDPGVRSAGCMMDFFGTGWDVARRMGLADELDAVRYPIDRMEFVDRDGRAYAKVPLDRIRKLLKGRYIYLRHSDLERILHERARSAEVEIRFGTSVKSLSAHAHSVDVKLSSGKLERFELVFGADGVHSRIRTLAFGEEEAFAFHLGGHVAAFHIERSQLTLDGAFTLHEEADRIAGLYPVAEGAADATLVFRHRDIGHVAPEERLPLLRTIFSGPGQIEIQLLKELPASLPVFFDSLTQIRMPAWHHGRVALLGDACGCLTLLAGQSTSMAMAGAYVLATELQRHANHTAAFEAYEQLMEPAVMKRQIEVEKFVRLLMPSAQSRPWRRRLMTRLIFSRLGLRVGLRFFGTKSLLAAYPATP